MPPNSFADAEKAIQNRLSNNFSALPIRWENIANNPNEDVSNGHVALFINEGLGAPASVSVPRLDRYVGVIIIRIYFPHLTGTRQAKTHADTLHPLWNMQQFQEGNSGMIITSVARLEGPNSESIPWFYQLMAEYRREVTN